VFFDFFDKAMQQNHRMVVYDKQNTRNPVFKLNSDFPNVAFEMID